MKELESKLNEKSDHIRDFDHRRQDAETRLKKLKEENENIEQSMNKSNRKFD